jgi:hypothetical protein
MSKGELAETLVKERHRIDPESPKIHHDGRIGPGGKDYLSKSLALLACNDLVPKFLFYLDLNHAYPS